MLKKTLVFFLLLPIASASQPPEYTLDFVVNPSVKTVSISRSEVSQIFTLGIRSWDTGERIQVILPPIDSLSFKRLATDELGMSSISYLELLRIRNVKDTLGRYPIVYASSEAFVVVKVAQIPNSIGYFYDSISLNTGIGVRILKLK